MPIPGLNQGSLELVTTVENSRELARFAAHHQPFYEKLYAQRLDVTPWEHNAGP